MCEERKPDLLIDGIPIYFDDEMPKEDVVYLVNGNLPKDRKEVLIRILNGVLQTKSK